MSISQAEVSALHLRAKYPVQSAVLKSKDALAIEDAGYKVWLSTIFPTSFDTNFIDVHTDFWEWGWKFLIALRDKQPLTKEDKNAFLALWSRNYGKSTHAEIFTAAACCVVGFGIFLYVSGSQELADSHLANIEKLLTSDGVTHWYPEHSRPKKSQITGANRAWTQKKLATEGGVTVWAIGLNVGVRGIRDGKDRVKGFILDDIDSFDDSPQIALNKANTLASSVLPTSDTSFFVIGAQNLISEHSVFHRIYTKQDMMLAHRVCSPPTKAFENLETSFKDGRDMITGGTSNWPGRVTEDVAQTFIDTFGLIRFMAEFQHDFSSNKQGLCLPSYDDDVHVVTQSEFNSAFNLPEDFIGVPTRWWKYQAHDHARTKTAYHANVTGTVSVASMNESYAGFIFLHDLMSFPAQTEPDEVALRILQRISPEVEVNGIKRTWDMLLESSFKRDNLDSFQSDTTRLIRMRRAILSKVIPPLVPSILARKNYKGWRMSHEAINAAGKVYKEVFGLPFVACNPGADGGLDQFNHYLKVDYRAKHPFTQPSEARIQMWMNRETIDRNTALKRISVSHGVGGIGFSRTFIIVPDSELAYTAEVASERLNDEMLCRYQFQHWRYTTPTLNDKGEKEWGPMKMHDDFPNALAMMLFHDNMPQAAPLSKGETVQEYLPVALKDETIQAEVDGETRGKLLMMQAMKMKQIEKKVERKPSKNRMSVLRRFQNGR